MPYRMIVCVWPPQISMSTHGRVQTCVISEASARAISPSRYSSMYFIFTAGLRLGRLYAATHIDSVTLITRSGDLSEAISGGKDRGKEIPFRVKNQAAAHEASGSALLVLRSPALLPRCPIPSGFRRSVELPRHPHG